MTRGGNHHLTQNLQSFIQAAQALSFEEVDAIVKSGCGTILVTNDGERHGVGPEFILAHKFGVSKRSAYRHIRNGTMPSRERRIGGDGKTLPRGESTTSRQLC